VSVAIEFTSVDKILASLQELALHSEKSSPAKRDSKETKQLYLLWSHQNSNKPTDVTGWIWKQMKIIA
jgi:hypothetical protein